MAAAPAAAAVWADVLWCLGLGCLLWAVRDGAELVENGALSQEEGERLLAAYEDYCAKLTAYGETLFAETFAFYDTLTEEKPE